MNILIGNIIALVASLMMVYTGTLKNRKKILSIQTIYISLLVVSNVVLGGISGAIINTINIIRNILCYNNKLGILSKIIISILSAGLTLKFNNLGLIGWLPLLASLIYLWLMNVKNVKKFKLLIVITLILWAIYDFSIKSYSAFLFDVITIILNIHTLPKQKRKKQNKIKTKS